MSLISDFINIDPKQVKDKELAKEITDLQTDIQEYLNENMAESEILEIEKDNMKDLMDLYKSIKLEEKSKDNPEPKKEKETSKNSDISTDLAGVDSRCAKLILQNQEKKRKAKEAKRREEIKKIKDLPQKVKEDLPNMKLAELNKTIEQYGTQDLQNKFKTTSRKEKIQDTFENIIDDKTQSEVNKIKKKAKIKAEDKKKIEAQIKKVAPIYAKKLAEVSEKLQNDMLKEIMGFIGELGYSN